MKNLFLSRFEADNLRKTLIYFVIALLLIIISLLMGITDTSLPALMFPCGIAFLFYALLRPWANAKYYGIMCIIISILLIFFMGVVLKRLSNNLEREIGEPVFFIGLIGVIVGIIGVFRFRKYD